MCSQPFLFVFAFRLVWGTQRHGYRLRHQHRTDTDITGSVGNTEIWMKSACPRGDWTDLKGMYVGGRPEYTIGQARVWSNGKSPV